MDFVIHKLLKDVKGPVIQKYRHALIKPTNDEISFVNDVSRLFQRQQSGRIFGNFESNLKKFPFSGLLAKHESNGDFLDFSKKAAGILVDIMKKVRDDCTRAADRVFDDYCRRATVVFNPCLAADASLRATHREHTG